MDENRLLLRGDPSVPTVCTECSGEVEYQGLGSYKCKECGHVMYDDYGKVRNYLDEHRGATAYDVSMATGVPQGKIRQMIREEKFEITQNSSVFMKCEICGTSIRSGRYCEACMRKVLAADAKADKRSSSKSMQGFGMARSDATGEKRFRRS